MLRCEIGQRDVFFLRIYGDENLIGTQFVDLIPCRDTVVGWSTDYDETAG